MDLIQVRLEHEKQVAAGQPARVLCALTNNDLEDHRVGVVLTAYSAPYSNVSPTVLVSAQRDFCLQPTACEQAGSTIIVRCCQAPLLTYNVSQ
ncbi:hypothetical protein V5799_023476 [Amblyomma americanum]|uniref:Uncharacterized protein n=1 Tax=Amblyomma americanum TaxID=6943 RepID=A0AAQ4FHR8_AMBAM